MKVYTLDIDSGERDATLHPESNSFTLDLKTPVFNVTHLEVVSVRLPKPEVVHRTNNRFTVEDDYGAYEVTLDPDSVNRASGSTVATYIEGALASAGCDTIDQVAYTNDKFVFSNTAATDEFSLKFYTGTDGWASNVSNRTNPNHLLGFNAVDVASSSSSLTGHRVAELIHVPNTLVLKVSTGSRTFDKDVYATSPFYTGTFMNTDDSRYTATYADSSNAPSKYFVFYGQDDAFVHEFNTGSQKEIASLTFEWFVKENNKLCPLDIGISNWAIKLKLHGTKDKLENLPKITEEDIATLTLPPPVHIPELDVRKNLKRWEQYIPIVVIIIIGVVLMASISGQSRTPAPPAS